MTLVAALTVCETPVLFGDLLLQQKDGTGARRKIMRLRPNLAVGWCDTYIFAKAVFRHLNETLGGRPTVGELGDALKAFSAESGQVAVQLTGWVLGNTNCAFMWDGNYPNEFVQDAKRFILGTGADPLWSFLENHNLDSQPSDGKSHFQHASMQTLTVTGNLMRSDLSDREQEIRSGFGIGYDILIGNSGRFEYLSPIVYAALSAQVDCAGNISQLSRPWGVCQTRNIGEHTLIQIGRNVEGVMDIHLISPVLPKETRASEERLKRALLHGPYEFRGLYCVVFVQLIEGTQRWPPLVIIAPHDAPMWRQSNKRGIQIEIGSIRSAAAVMAQRRKGRW